MWQADDAAICGCKMRLTPAKKEARSQDIRSSARTLEQDVRKLAGFNCTCPNVYTGAVPLTALI